MPTRCPLVNKRTAQGRTVVRPSHSFCRDKACLVLFLLSCLPLPPLSRKRGEGEIFLPALNAGPGWGQILYDA